MVVVAIVTMMLVDEAVPSIFEMQFSSGTLSDVPKPPFTNMSQAASVCEKQRAIFRRVEPINHARPGA